jgi:hypothetical protein
VAVVVGLRKFFDRGVYMSEPLSLEELLQKMPPEIKIEVYDFAQYLMSKKKKAGRSRLKQNWAGGLKAYKKKYSSLELQKKALEWRSQ